MSGLITDEKVTLSVHRPQVKVISSFWFPWKLHIFPWLHKIFELCNILIQRYIKIILIEGLSQNINQAVGGGRGGGVVTSEYCPGMYAPSHRPVPHVGSYKAGMGLVPQIFYKWSLQFCILAKFLGYHIWSFLTKLPDSKFSGWDVWLSC
jgi:hypothetical protein